MLAKIAKLSLLIVLVSVLASCSHFPGWSASENNNQHYGDEDMAPGQAPQKTYQQLTYKKADRPVPQRVRARKGCIEHNGQKICGYDCKVSGGQVKCADAPDKRCVTSPSGQIVCGYDCVSSSHGARCGKYKYDNCVKNQYGDVRCGNNCYVREDDGEIVCGK